MGEVSQAAMDALLAVHRPDRVHMWNPEAPLNTFWDISSQVIYNMSQKLIGRQICNYREVLRWLRDILTCRNEFLAKQKEYANIGTAIPICKQAHIKLEVSIARSATTARDSLCKLLQKYPKGQGEKMDECQMEAIHRAVAKRRVSHHSSSEHDLEGEKMDECQMEAIHRAVAKRRVSHHSNSEHDLEQIQTHVKEVVGSEMSPALYPILFDQIKAIIDKFFDQQQQVMLTDVNTQFVEHTIYIMKSILDNKRGGQPTSSQEHLSTTSIEGLMLAIVR
ncbi:putative Neurofibromin [Operophtera brumata]|uniref:Putative Neurofibromin n=1 Tax=Operophtera brumata TaxID=104452 RepID=A0A0L7LN71_OPEBR|nr:putative Neurofibromin [Operophtera brumata]